MKAVTIKLSHGQIWTAETSDGKRSTSSTLEGALRDITPFPSEAPFSAEAYVGIKTVFDGIRDSEGGGQIVHGQASA